MQEKEKSINFFGVLILVVIIVGIILLMYYSHDESLSNFYRGDHR